MNSSNRLRLNYELEAQSFAEIQGGIIDIHSHIQGSQAARLYAKAAAHYGVTLTYSMTPLPEIEAVKEVLGEKIRFIAIPQFHSKDLYAAFGVEYIRDLPAFKEHGATIVKFWNAPRIYEASSESFIRNPFRINSSYRRDAMKAAMDLGMTFMAHIGDPDTWFATKYRDAQKYGTKRQQYQDFEEVLESFPVTWIAAHMGGYPEDLVFLSQLLERHQNLYLDCSATKWIVRELSKHPTQELNQFFTRWRGRILFGSDIVTRESHLTEGQSANEMDGKASSESEAYDLYASRYWALRTLLESSYHGESPIADPDLYLIDALRYSPLDAPVMRGCKLDSTTLGFIYRDAALKILPHA